MTRVRLGDMARHVRNDGPVQWGSKSTTTNSWNTLATNRLGSHIDAHMANTTVYVSNGGVANSCEPS